MDAVRTHARPRWLHRHQRHRPLLLVARLAASAVLLLPVPVWAEGSWLLVPTFESPDIADAPLQALLAPWQQQLPRAVDNAAAGRVYEQRHSIAARELPQAQRERMVAAINRALEQLALGDLEASAETLRAVEALRDVERDVLLHDESIAQKLFDACMMRAYQLARQDRTVEANHQVGSCAMDFPHYANAEHAFAPRVHGPPQLANSFDRASKELARERTASLSLRSGTTPCRAYLNGLSVGKTPIRLQVRRESLRVQLDCGRLTRSHTVAIADGENALEINSRLDEIIVTTGHLQLRYRSPSQLDSFMVEDGLALRQALGVDRVGLLAIRPNGNKWSMQVHILDAVRRMSRMIGSIDFAEVAGYDPERLQRLTLQMKAASANDESDEHSVSSPISLTAPPPPAVETTAPSRSSPADARAGSSAFPILGITTAALGIVGVGTSWVLFAERRAYRLREWPTVSTGDEAAYERRGTLIMTALTIGAVAAAVSPYFWVPESAEVPAYAWILGGVGLAAGALGVGMALTDEHCGPETVLPLREPCRGVRADSLFGIEIALTALPLITIPFNFLLRQQTSAAVSVTSPRGGIALHISGPL